MTWQDEHRKIEKLFLEYLGANAGLVLKGGTSLMFCYDLNRFSEDLDFDAESPDVSTIDVVKAFCKEQGFECFEKKNTPTVQRCTIHYGGEHPLKVETSYRRMAIPDDEKTVINGIRVYTIDVLARMKLNAYLSRDKIRDLFDVVFITNHYWDDLPEITRSSYQMAFAEKGLEQFDFVIADQNDALIDNDVLAVDFLTAYEKVGVRLENDKTAPAKETENASRIKAIQQECTEGSAQLETENKSQKTPNKETDQHRTE